jgi:hypothetical protein
LETEAGSMAKRGDRLAETGATLGIIRDTEQCAERVNGGRPNTHLSFQ